MTGDGAAKRLLADVYGVPANPHHKTRSDRQVEAQEREAQSTFVHECGHNHTVNGLLRCCWSVEVAS